MIRVIVNGTVLGLLAVLLGAVLGINLGALLVFLGVWP